MNYLFKKICAILFLTLSLSLSSAFAETPTFEAGVDYQIIPTTSATIPETPHNHISVTEFFNYGCPWCYRLESTLEKWLAKKPTDVVFSRVPVQFEPGWEYYAKAYYVLKALNKEKDLSPVLFEAVQKQQQDLSNEAALTKFFAEKGLDAKQFSAAFNYSPEVDAEMVQGMQLMQKYQIFEVPTIVVAEKYKTNLRMAQGNNQRFIQIVEFLIEQERNSKAATKIPLKNNSPS